MLRFITPPTTTRPTHAPHSMLVSQLCLAALAVLLWMLLYPYAGMRHDARLYTLQAQGLMSPELYGHDIFLKYGSQDNYTFFTPLYAQLCRWLGIEHAAALLTAIGQSLFLLACWGIARQLSTALWATITVCLILILPSNYGSDFIFTYFETFLTPRIFAESLCLLSLLAYWQQRLLLSILLILAALALHPIMGMAGVAFLGIHSLWPHRKLLLTAVSAAFMLTLTLWLLPAASALKFDAEWLHIVDSRAPCLFIKNWVFADLARLTTPALTLILATIYLPNRQQRQIAVSALLVGIVGMAINVIGADWLKVVLITQGQAWRWLWLATLLAVVLLPNLLRTLWQQALPGHTTALLLSAAWLVRNESFSLGIVLLTVCSAAALHRKAAQQHNWQLYRFFGAATLLATLSWMLAVGNLYAGQLIYTYHWPNWIDEWLNFLIASPLPILLLATTIWAIHQQRLAAIVLSISLGITALLFAPYSWRNWIYQEYSPEVVAAMAPWRELIPPGSDVLWMYGPPTPVWMALQRGSYISSIQTTVTLFSRQAAFALRERAKHVDPVFPGVQPMRWIGTSEVFTPSTHRLAELCAQLPVRFIVSQETLDQAPIAVAPSELPASYRDAKLYQCPPISTAAT